MAARMFTRMFALGALFLCCAFVVGGILARPASAYLGFGCGAAATWSDGRYVTGACGSAGLLYAYQKPLFGSKVNSLYVANSHYPGSFSVEAGWTSTGSNPGPGLPAMHDPWFFAVQVIYGQYEAFDFYDTLLPVNERSSVWIRNETGTSDGWTVWCRGAFKMTMDDFQGYLTTGMSAAGEERSDPSTLPKASITGVEFETYSGGSYAWQNWNHGNWWIYQWDGTYEWRFNHVADSNHWIYTNDHDS